MKRGIMPRGILTGIRVLDFGRYIAGPYCSALLGDLGAEVVRIERVDGNDDRYIMPATPGGEGALFQQMNRNKRSLALDITRPEGQALVRRLVAGADVVVANLPGKARVKLGLDYDTLSSIRQDVILTSITAYGTGGPFGDLIGFDGMGQALSGAVYLTGQEGQPFRSAVSYVDYTTGLSAAFGTLAALISRRRTGRGQHVEASLLGSALTMTNPMLIEEASGARSRQPTGNRSPIAGPSDLFATRDGWIFVQVIGQEMFERWMELVGAVGFRGDPRFSDDMARGENGQALSEVTAAWCAQFSTAECLERLNKARVPGYPVLSPSEALRAREISDGGFFDWIEPNDGGEAVPIMRSPVSLSGAPAIPPRPAPALGADTDDILRGLGLSDTEIGELVARGIVGGPAYGADQDRPKTA
ncbi:CaiB/BaiF CoA transferase family protein [Xanthobacteraceae bacterium A53D]